MSHEVPEGPVRQPLVHAVRASRRRLLAMLAAAPAALGLAIAAQRDPAAEAKKNGKKRKNKKKKKNGGGGYSPDGEERAFLDLINAYRRQNGAGNLSLNDQLGAAAEYHSQEMARKNYFSHKLSNGDSPEQNIRRFGYTGYSAVGENIAAGFPSADEAFKAWKNSADHDKNMRSKNFSEIGIGRAQNGNSKYGWYWTTTFGSR